MQPHRLIIVGGKGGVGRTTVAVALGVALARQGRRTLLAHVRTRQPLAEMLACGDVIGTDICTVEPNLWAVNMEPQAAIREIGLMVLRFRAVYRAVLENRIVRSFLRAVPALEDYSMIGKAWYHTTELHEGLLHAGLLHDGRLRDGLPRDGPPRYETVIFDGPATGHLISMLRIPQVILDAVPRGPLTTDARKARDLLADATQACMWIVTQAEELPTSEAIDLYWAARRDLGIAVDRVVVNALYPDALQQAGLTEAFAHLDAAIDSAVATPSSLSPSPLMSPALATGLRSLRLLQRRREVNDRYLRVLKDALPVPRLELPYVFAPKIARPEIDLLADTIASSLLRPC